MNSYEINLTGVTDTESLHDRLEQALPMPEYYGRNLDALYDVLTSMEEPFQIRFLTDSESEISPLLHTLKHLCQDVEQELEAGAGIFEWIESEKA